MRILVPLTALLILTGSSLAQTATVTPHPQDGKLNERFRRADTNRDGVVSNDEARTASLWFQDDFSSVDTDNSGTVSLFEFGEALQTRLSHSMSDFDAADTNHDGRLSADEMKHSQGIADILKPSKRKKAAVSRPEYESYAIEHLYRSADLPSVAPNIIDKRF